MIDLLSQWLSFEQSMVQTSVTMLGSTCTGPHDSIEQQLMADAQVWHNMSHYIAHLRDM